MSKAISLLPEDGIKGFGINAGLHRVVSSEIQVHQYKPNKTTGEQSEPFVCWAIGYLPIDAAGNAVGEAEVDYGMKIAPGYGEPLSSAKFAPAASPDGPALPLQVGSRGGFVFPIGDSQGLSVNSKVLKYIAQLFEVGFLKERLIASGMDVGILVGTEGDVMTKTTENDGTDKKTGAKLKDTKMLVFKSIRRFGYENPDFAKAAHAPAPAAHTPATTAPAPAVAATAGAHKTALAIMQRWSEKYKAVKREQVPLAELLEGFMAVAMKEPRFDPTDRAKAKELLSDTAFYKHPDAEKIAALEGVDLIFL